MILFSHYFNLPLFRKLTLQIELGYHLKNSDEIIAFEDANDDSEEEEEEEEDDDDDDDPFNWSPANILQNVKTIFNVKKKIHEMEEANIKAQQKRDKEQETFGYQSVTNPSKMGFTDKQSPQLKPTRLG